MFYIGVFYEYGFFDSYRYSYYNNSYDFREVVASNRTFGFNLGINL
jgi:hypothetical protein